MVNSISYEIGIFGTLQALPGQRCPHPKPSVTTPASLELQGDGINIDIREDINRWHKKT